MSVPNPDAAPRNELSLRGLILGVIITVVFTAANVFFGLRAGLTFNSSIPAAVISMAVLRMFQGVTLQENNMVQTVASAAGTLSSIIFVLPGLIMVGWWTGFPYWQSFWICALGGVLGVMYSIPLRRALVTNSDLPYPEGIACAEVLKVGAGAGEAGGAAAAEAGRDGLMAVIIGTVVSAVFNLITYTQAFAADVVSYFRLRGNAVTGYDFGLSLALFGVGHLVGLSVGIAMLIGVFITWGGVMPWLSAAGADAGSATDIALALWKSKARFIGAGTIGVAAIWTLLKLVQPVAAGLSSAMAASRVRKAGQGATLPRTEQDIPIGWVGLVALVCLGPIGWLLWGFAGEAGIGEHAALLVGGGLVFTVLMSFVVSAVCGYMAGLIGSSNSPLSGVGYLVVIGAALLLVFVVKPLLGGADHGSGLVAFALFITAVVFAVATIANNNLQDLKTGQLVDATPWKQQVALIVGVVAGAAVIPPVMDMLNHGYGFAGAPGVTSSNALAAPQAALMSSLASGVIQGNLPWNMIVYGIAIGAAVILLDEVLARSTRHMRVPPLAVGLGMYLPLAVTLTIVVGAVVGWVYDRWAARSREPGGAKQLGVLLASGMIVGESLVGVVLSFIVYYTGNQTPLALVSDSFANGIGQWLGGIAFVLTVALLYRWLSRLTARPRAA